jgi:hypothetical protein
MQNNFADVVNSAYAATRMTLAEERQYQREHECQRLGCDAPVDETKPCDICEHPFCPAHLFDGLCKGCAAIDAAADELNERMAF